MGLQPLHLSSQSHARTGAADTIAHGRQKRRSDNHVFVVELADQVWNLGHKHKGGILASTDVRDFGLRLLSGLYAMYNPMPYDAARKVEVALGIALREAGYGVWQA